MATTADHKPLIAALNGQKQAKVPFWLMRQAGRYLPEYRALRADAGGFMDLVFNPDFAAEVTMQPIRRFGMDGAILFSDILVIPEALGQAVTFTAGEGPSLPPLDGMAGLSRLNMDKFDEVLAPILETVRKTRRLLTAEGFDKTALIGFAGAPWTVACYMVEGGGSRDFNVAKSWAYREPDHFAALIDLLTKATIRYLSAQISAGAEAVQLFDSWAGVLNETQFQRWVVQPAQMIAQALRAAHPDIPLIGFPRGSGALYEHYARLSGVNAIGLDFQVPLEQAIALQKICPVQGNLDPACLLAGGDVLKREVARILDGLRHGPFVFNLGHGVIKETPPEHVAQLAQQIRQA